MYNSHTSIDMYAHRCTHIPAALANIVPKSLPNSLLIHYPKLTTILPTMLYSKISAGEVTD